MAPVPLEKVLFAQGSQAAGPVSSL